MTVNQNQSIDKAIATKAKGVKLLALDVDGVLTDGKLYFHHDGEYLKSFSILDGLGIKLLADHGIETAIITGRKSGIVEKRARELNIKHLVQQREDKLAALEELLSTIDVTLEQTAYLGDDLPDLAAIKRCGLGITVANGYELVKQHADYVCKNSGGNGAVREVADILLKASGHFDNAIKQFY